MLLFLSALHNRTMPCSCIYRLLRTKVRSLLLGLLFFFHFSPLLVNSSSEEVLGLIVFKASITHNVDKLSSWNENYRSPCNWTGVTCEPRSGTVSELNLSDLGLSGRLSKGLLKLSLLQKLILSRNNFTGSLSPEVLQLSNLTVLDLSENGFSGSVPDELFEQCGALRSISLAKNKLLGPIPKSVANCSSLVSVDFSGNQFSGALPRGLWSLSSLRFLDLSDNMLKDEIPEDFWSLKNLSALNLSRNSFSGRIPSKIQNLTLCSILDLGANGFSGSLPEWIGEMRSLEILNLSENNFSGQIPHSFGKLRFLKILNVSKNSISGSLPDSLSKCENLLTFDVSHNYLNGPFPSWVFKIGLQQVVLSDNGLSGSFANALASSSEISHKQLLALDVYQNKLSSEIPPALGDFESLQLLNVARNSLTGRIPKEIGQVQSLSSLSLAHNQITGPIPSSLANLSNLQIVDLSFNNLTGPLPITLANLTVLSLFNVSHNQLQGELPPSPFFNKIDPSSVSDNPLLCGAVVKISCSKVLPKPIVLNPNSTGPATSDGDIPPTFVRGKKILSISALIAIGAAASIIVGVIAVTVLNLSVSRQSRAAIDFSGEGEYDFSRSPSSTSGEEMGKLVMFSGGPGLATTTHALLSKDRELGRGGFGSVYQAALGDGRCVAVKRLAVSGLVKSQDDFEREVRRLGRARHGNLVALDGYYWTPSLQLLIYEFISGGSLYACLHESGPLSWDERFGVILGLARGLAHLHQMGIIHYNLKSSNVLIDGKSGEAKVADYGLAKLLPMLDRYVLSSKIQSALGYMAPEFACKSVKITDKCDVYGFGILVLEIVTGRRPVEYMEDDVVVLSDMVRGALEEGRVVEECVDSRLRGKFAAEEVIPVMKLGLICTSQVPSSRPDMMEVVNILEVIRSPDGLCYA